MHFRLESFFNCQAQIHVIIGQPRAHLIWHPYFPLFRFVICEILSGQFLKIPAWGAILALTLGMGGRTVRMPPAIHSLVVLPFDNLSGDASQDYFADGMTDALITALAKIRSLRVISRTSSMHYKGSRKSLPEIAKELDVDGVLEGSFVRSGNQLRITAQLIEAPSDQHLWAESYDRDVSGVIQLQDDVVRTVAREIALKLTPQEQTRLVQAHPANIEAYEAYLRGRYFWNLRTVDGLKKDYAPAYAGLADATSRSACVRSRH